MTRSKYGAVKTTVDGIRFDSKQEAARYQELLLLVTAGEIRALELQPRYPLMVEGQKVGTYVADFRYHVVAEDATVVEDSKGMPTPVYKLKKKLMWAIYGIVIHETYWIKHRRDR